MAAEVSASSVGGLLVPAVVRHACGQGAAVANSISGAACCETAVDVEGGQEQETNSTCLAVSLV